MIRSYRLIAYVTAIIAVAIIAAIFFLPKEQQWEVTGACMVAFCAADGLDLIHIRRKEKNPLLDQYV